MYPLKSRVVFTLVLGIGQLLVWASLTPSQISENATDPNGYKIPYPRVRLVHSTDTRLEGTTAFLRADDPFLFYQLGRDLVQRQFRPADGVDGRSGILSVPLYVAGEVTPANHGRDARFARDHTNSCGMCHSMPFREPGSGQTISSTGSMGRNTPHFYGAGLVEMIGAQTRQKILNLYDRNKNGLIDRAEVEKQSPVRIAPITGVAPVDFGDLSPDADGFPRLNSVFRVWYVNEKKNLIDAPRGFNDPRVAAYGFAMQPFGWGRGYRQVDGRNVAEGGEASTLRSIYALASDVHLGLQAFDPSQQRKSSDVAMLGGETGVSLNGALQFDFDSAADRGRKQNAAGLSLDDPDHDGQITELTEGDVDAAEFYMLNAPAPAVRQSPSSERGRKVIQQLGCLRCHVENWQLEAANEDLGFAGDRRFFHLETHTLSDQNGVSQLVGKLVKTYRRLGNGEYTFTGAAFRVERVYSDFKHWDIGPEFYERRYDGTLQREHRTAPLWGVGSTAPYGHSGQFQSLDEVISAHKGAAEKEGKAYRSLNPALRRALVEFLASLVLFPTDEIATDIDGDGVRSDSYAVARQSVGYERFDARFLFKVPPRYRRLYNVKDYLGREIPLCLIDNVADTYRLGLLYRRDADGDGFPDVLRPAERAIR